MKRFVLMGGNQFGAYVIGFARSREEAEELIIMYESSQSNMILIDCETKFIELIPNQKA